MSQKITTAMILAAGRGERLRPLTDTTPKPLIEVGGKKLIEYHIENLKSAGITDIVINTAWLADKIHAALGDGNRYGVCIQYSDEGEAIETAGGISKALALLGTDPFIVVSADIWCDFDFSSWTDKVLSTQAHLLLVSNPEHNLTGDFALKNGKLANDGAKMHTYSGIGLYTAEFFSSVPATKAALAPVIREKNDLGLVSAELFTGRWADVGTIDRLHELEQMIEKK